MRLTTDKRSTGRVVIKQADNQTERRRLEREAAVVRAASHPGVVQLVGLEADNSADLCLVTREVNGTDLARHPPLEPEEVMGLGAALATTLADLHDLGVSHGAIEASHVLVDPGGQPILCSLGRSPAQPSPEDAAVAERHDVRCLAAMLAGLLGEGKRNGTPHALRAALDSRQHRTPPARTLARALSEPAAGARLPAPSPRTSANSAPDAADPAPDEPGSQADTAGRLCRAGRSAPVGLAQSGGTDRRCDPSPG